MEKTQPKGTQTKYPKEAPLKNNHPKNYGGSQNRVPNHLTIGPPNKNHPRDATNTNP